MTISKKLALLGVIAAIAGAPTLAQEPSRAPNTDMSIDLGGLGLAPGGPPPMTAQLPPPMGMPAPDGDVLFLAGPDMGDGSEMVAIAIDGPAEGQLIARGGFAGPLGGLNLTDEQYEKLFALRRDNAGKSAARMGELMSLHMTLQDLMMQPELDRAKITATQSRINALKTELANQRLDDKLAMMSILTADQRREMRRNMLQRMGGFHGGPGRGFGGRMGGHCPMGPGACPKGGPGGRGPGGPPGGPGGPGPGAAGPGAPAPES